MTKYTELTEEAEISLDASRHWLMQGIYWVLTAAIAIFDGSYAGSDPPFDFVVRDRRIGGRSQGQSISRRRGGPRSAGGTESYPGNRDSGLRESRKSLIRRELG